MAPYLILFGRGVPTYGLLALLGAGAAWGYFHRRLRARGENPGRAEQAFLWGALGAVAGGKVLYLLPRLPQLTADLPLLAQDCWRWAGPCCGSSRTQAAFAPGWMDTGSGAGSPL